MYQPPDVARDTQSQSNMGATAALTSLLKPPVSLTDDPAHGDAFFDQIDDVDPQASHALPSAPAWESLLDRLEEGLPIETHRVTGRPPLKPLFSTLLALAIAFGLGLGGAMAALLFRHRVEVILSRLL